MKPFQIISVDDIMRMMLPFFPNVVMTEADDGEVIVHTGMQVISSEGHLAPLEVEEKP